MYRYSQTFTIPGDTKTYTRTQLMTALKVEPYDKGVVLPHEQTFPKHKEDRLKILEATRAHLECIYGLFEDPDRSVHELIVAAPASQSQEFVADDGVTNRLEVIDDPASIQAIAAHMADKKVWIADGHHRYETAVTYREMQGAKDGLIAEDFMMMALSSMSDPGLVILPTHRIVPNVPLDEAAFEAKLKARFDVERLPNNQLMAALKATPANARTIAIAWKTGLGFVCRIPNANQVLEWIDGPESARLKELDVTILHRIIFEELLGLSGLEFFSYTRDPDEALGSVSNGADAAFLMNPPSVDDMRVIALGQEKMPQKSTYYYPKLLSGLALWSLSDFERQ